MRLPRKAVLIRLAIYVPLLGYFGWRALAHMQAEREAAESPSPPPAEAPLEDPFKGMPTKTIEVDGKQVKVYEITPEQAETYLGVTPGQAAAPQDEGSDRASATDTDADAEATAPPTGGTDG